MSKYWDAICEIAEAQREKGLSKYGQGLEENTAPLGERIRHLEEELIDGLMYCEWIKEQKASCAITPNEYQRLAMRTSRSDLSGMEHILNGALGLAGEAGEVADLIKKATMQGHPLDVEKVLLELGDVLWYVAETANAIGWDMESIMSRNIEKLKKRYPQGFESVKSVNREEV